LSRPRSFFRLSKIPFEDGESFYEKASAALAWSLIIHFENIYNPSLFPDEPDLTCLEINLPDRSCIDSPDDGKVLFLKERELFWVNSLMFSPNDCLLVLPQSLLQ
jgi:hypothetical protein